MAFADDLSLRPLTDAEVTAVAGDQELLRHQQLARALRPICLPKG